MPTGYTTSIYNGKKVSFRDFALSCARAFGAAIHQRDDNASDQIKLRELDGYHSKELEKLEKQGRPNPSKAEFIEQKKAEIKEHKKTISKAKKLKQSYENMLEQTRKWQPPTPEHERLKEFMIEQLESSIQNDCPIDYYETKIKQTESMTYKEYIKILCEKYDWSLSYHTKGIEKEKQSVERANAWITSLHKSLES